MPIDPADHPSAEDLAAYIDATLDETERTKIEAHLSGCSECREVLVAPKDLAAFDQKENAMNRKVRFIILGALVVLVVLLYLVTAASQ